MAPTKRSSKIPGVRFKEHETRKHALKKDRYFYIYYQLNGKKKEEGLGWASQGMTEKKAASILLELKENIRLGKHPQTLAEMREMNKKAEEAAAQQELETEAERITLREVFEKYFPVHKAETTEKTWKNTECYYRNWIDTELGSKRLRDITVDDIQATTAKVIETHSSRTADFVKAVLRQIFNFAKSRELYFRDNPVMKIKIKREDNKRNRFLTKEEARLLLDELWKHSIDTHDVALMALYGGFRADEIFSLRWEDLDWHSGRVTAFKTKNGQYRTQPMHPMIIEMLERRYISGKEGYIFKNQTGGKIDKISKTFPRVVEKLGFNKGITDERNKVVFHTLRHTYASWLVMKGVDLYTVQKLMGHKSNQMTQRYAHLAPGHLEKAVNTLERI